jgi:hypothetical protein
MKGKKLKIFTVLLTAIFMQNLLFGQIPMVAYAGTTNVTMKITDGTGIKDSFAIEASNINKYLNPTILQGNSYMNVDVNGSYNFFKYQFINQSAIPVNIPTAGWNDLDLALQQQVNNDDVITDKQGNLNWRGYDVNHLPTITNTAAWQNSDIVFKYPSAATNYKPAGVSTSWNAYGAMQSVVPYTVTTVDNKTVTVNKKWVSNSIFMTSSTGDLTASTSPDSTNYKESSKFWGYMSIPKDGKYYFGIRSDDGSNGSLTVDGITTKFTDMFKVQGTTWGSTGNAFDLKALNVDGSKRYYPIYLEYFNWGGASNFQMRYICNPTSTQKTNFVSYGRIDGSTDAKTINSAANLALQAPSTWFYPSKNVTPGEYSTTTFTGSSGVQFPTNPGDYYIAYQTGTGSTIGSQGFYGPFTIEGKTSLSVSKTVIGGVNKATEKSPFTLEYTIQPPPTIAATNNFKNPDGSYKTNILLTNIKLQDVFPANISINSTGTDVPVAISGQNMVMTVPDITYTYNGSVYALNSAQTQVKKKVSLTATNSGNYTLSSLGSSVLTFLDVNIIPTNGQFEFPSIMVNVVPVAPVITAPTTGAITNINKPVINGTSNANATVDIYIDGPKIATVIANGTGNWTYTPAIAMSDGTHNVTATATDSQGNTSVTSNVVSVTINTGKPALGSVLIKSNNANPIYAKVGDTVTLSFKEVSGALFGTTAVTIAGHTITATIGAENVYTAIYQMVSTDAEGIVPFTINFTNTLGSVGTQVTASTDGKNVTFNKTNPTLTPVSIKSNNINPLYAKVGDNVNLSFIANETLLGVPVITIAGHSVTATQGVGNSYTATYLMLSTDAEGIVPYTIDFKDLAGNIGTQVIRSTDGTSVIFDKTAPIAVITYSKNPIMLGEDIITVTYSEPVNVNETPQISINQQGTTDIMNQNMEVGADRRTWTFKYTVYTDNGGTYKDGVATVNLSSVHDVAGNTAATPTGNTFTIDTIAPTVTIGASSSTITKSGPITYTVNYSGADKVTLNSSDVILVKTGTADGTVTASGTGNTRTVAISNITGDGTLGIRIAAGTASDSAGNSASAPLDSTTFGVRNSPPTITLIPSSTNWTNANVTITVAASAVGSGNLVEEKRWLAGTKTLAEFTASVSTVLGGNTFSVSSNGDYTVYAKDIVGNESVRTINIGNIDKVAPIIAIGNYITAPTNQNITVAATTNEGTLNVGSYTFTSNGNFDYVATDEAGNVTTRTVTITNIDKVAPILTVVEPIMLDNKINNAEQNNVTISGTAEPNTVVKVVITDANGKKVENTVTSDATGNYTLSGISVSGLGEGKLTITATATDAAGNTSIVNKDVTKDTTAPVITITDPIMLDNKINNVEQNSVTISGTTELNTVVKVVITDANGKIVEKTVTADVTGNYTVSEIDVSGLSEGNLTVTATVTDAAGNTTTVNQEIQKDITAPTAPTLTATPTSPTNGDVTVTVHYPNDATVKQYKVGELGTWNDYSNPIVLSDNNTVYAKCKDAADNTSEQGSLVISNIDKVPPVITISSYITTPTNKDITVTATTNEGTVNVATHTFAANGTFDFVAIDAAGNVTTKTVTISNIDKTPPATPILSADITTPTNGNVTVTITYPNDATIKEYKIGTSGEWLPYTGLVVIDTNCNVYAQCKDLAGNTSEQGSLVISNIDKTTPTAPIITLSTDDWSNKNVQVTITGSSAYSGIQKYQYKIGTSEWTDYTKLEIQNEGQTVIYARAVSNTGINGLESSKTVRIDKTSPKGNIVKSSDEWTNQNIILTFTANDTPSGSGVKRVKKPDGTWSEGDNTTTTYSVSECEIYTFEVEDNAGNTYTESITITNVDKATIKTGLFVNNKFSEKSTISIVKGFNTNLAFQITNLKNQQVKLEVNNTEFIKISDIKVYATTDLKNQIKDVKVTETVNADETVNTTETTFTIENLPTNNNNYVFIFKATALKITTRPISDVIKINGFERTEKHFINVVKLPPLQ